MDETLTRQLEQLPRPEEKGSPEVGRAIAEIEATESDIAARTGLEGQALTDTTDNFLTDRAEHATDIGASDTGEVVETALLEGALEVTGERPKSNHNPIEELEDDGYDSQVTAGVQKLYEEHVTLPSGESAAEVVATTVMSHEMQREHYSSDSKEAGWDSSEQAQKQEQLWETAEIEAYKGNWFNLQQLRMSSPDFRQKFQQFIEKHKSSLDPGEPSSIFQKPENFQTHYQNQLDQFDSNLEHISSSVGYGNAADVGGKSASSLGHGKIGQAGTVYRDAIRADRTPLTGEQKDIIAAHEAYHGMIDIKGSAVGEVMSGFDWDTYNNLVDTTEINQPSYLRSPDELTARMAQFKNYFGMQGGEPFTADHIEYLRQHYLEDTGLDNGVSVMLQMITPATEKQFIELMNTLPV